MRVAVAVHGRFHGFDLAAQLWSRRMLARLDTTYPRFACPAKMPVRTLPALEVIRRAWPRLALPGNPDLFIARNFARSLARNLPEADILTVWSAAALEAIAPAKCRGMKVVLERGSTHMAHQTQVLRDLYAQFGLPWSGTDPRMIERELAEYEAADSICTGSSFAKQSFIDHGIDPAKVVVNPYGVDLSRFVPGAGPRRKQILFVGSVGLRKGAPFLIQAFRKLPADWELHFVGPVEPALRTLLPRWDMTRIIFHGPKSGDDLVRAFQTASIFCLPSVEEGFGMVILQAMAAGLPVVASSATGGPDAGAPGTDLLITPPADVNSLAECLLSLALDPAKREAMGRAAKSKAVQGFSWNDYGRRAVDLYQMLTNPKPVW